MKVSREDSEGGSDGGSGGGGGGVRLPRFWKYNSYGSWVSYSEEFVTFEMNVGFSNETVT